MELTELIRTLMRSKEPLGGEVPTTVKMDFQSAKKLAQLQTLQEDFAQMRKDMDFCKAGVERIMAKMGIETSADPNNQNPENPSNLEMFPRQ